jgi:hypothetical protein
VILQNVRRAQIDRFAASLRLFPKGRAVPRRPSGSGKDPARTDGADLAVREMEIARVHRQVGQFRATPGVTAAWALEVDVRLENTGSTTWGYAGTLRVSAAMGTPETGLDPWFGRRHTGRHASYSNGKSVPLPRGLPPGSGGGSSARDERATLADGARFKTVRVALPVAMVMPDARNSKRRIHVSYRSRTWYTLTASVSSRADSNPGNNRLQLVFMLDDRGRVMRSRTRTPPPSRVRVKTK